MLLNMLDSHYIRDEYKMGIGNMKRIIKARVELFQLVVGATQTMME